MDATKAVHDWRRAVRPIWARHLAALGKRDNGDRALPEAWSTAMAEAWTRQWEVRAVVPLEPDAVHDDCRWAVVLWRSDEWPAPHLVYVHGTTVVDALQKATDLLRAGVDSAR